eukprot:TRINITY_DN409_c0_g1_i1.p1 TRINITY_DN409_c0_g1~~TRINITY_DN409_c0_g1_i1.p1  ORF type:complete len:240 (-),score=97.24 TRINITY_DN409_c0_g1_i1:69-737(-)
MEFWGQHLTENKPEIVEVPEEVILNVTGVALDSKHEQPVTITVEWENNKFTLATLKWGTIFQQPIDVRFSGGRNVTFVANGPVTLTGYWTMDDYDDEEGMYSFDDEAGQEFSSGDISDSDEGQVSPNEKRAISPQQGEEKSQKKVKTEKSKDTPASLPPPQEKSPSQPQGGKKGGKKGGNPSPNQPQGGKKGGNPSPNQPQGGKGGKKGGKGGKKGGRGPQN